MELEWKNFRGFTALEILTEIRKKINEMQCEPEQFIGRIIFMPMYNGIVWWEKWKHRIMHCEFQNSGRICKKNRARTVVVSRAWIRKNSTDQTRTSLTENGMVSLNTCCSTSAKWTFRIPWNQCFGTRSFEKQREWQLSIHFCGEPQTVEVVLRTIISVNQLSVYGTEADMCDELASRISDCSASRRRRSSWIRNSGTDVCITIGVFSALVYSNKAEILVERRRSHEEIQCCLDTNSADTFFCLRAFNTILEEIKSIQPALQDNLVLPSDFAEYIYHVGSSTDMHSIIQSGLIRGKDIKKGRQTVFFTAVNPMHTSTQAAALRRDEAQNCGVQTHLENTRDPNVLGQFESCSEEGIVFPSNEIKRDHPSQHSTSSVYWEVEAVSPGEVMKNKMYESLRSPRKLYWIRLGTKDKRILQALKREHPTPNPASTERLVAVKPIIGFKDYHTLQLNKNT